MSISASGARGLPGTVDIIERLGEVGFAHVKTDAGQSIIIEVRGDPKLGDNSKVVASFDPAHLHLFDEQGQRLN